MHIPISTDWREKPTGVPSSSYGAVELALGFQDPLVANTGGKTHTYKQTLQFESYTTDRDTGLKGHSEAVLLCTKHTQREMSALPVRYYHPHITQHLSKTIHKHKHQAGARRAATSVVTNCKMVLLLGAGKETPQSGISVCLSA